MMGFVPKVTFASGILKVCVAVPPDTVLVIPTGEVFILVVENVCDAAVTPFNVYNPLLPQVAFPYASEVNTAFDVNVPPVTFIVFVTSEVVVKVPVLSEVDEIFPDDVKDVAVIAPVLTDVDEIFPEDVRDVAVMDPVLTDVEEIFPDDTTDVAVIVPAAKPPLPSRLTIMFAVLDAVAEVIAEENVL